MFCGFLLWKKKCIYTKNKERKPGLNRLHNYILNLEQPYNQLQYQQIAQNRKVSEHICKQVGTTLQTIYNRLKLTKRSGMSDKNEFWVKL